MKNLLIAAIPFCLLFFACKKSDSSKVLQEDKGCIYQVTVPVSTHTISNADIPIVNSLFLNNNIDNRNFRYYQYMQDSLQTQYPPYIKVDYKTLRVDQYINGLRIFNNDLVFNFKNNVLYHTSGTIITVTKLNTITHLTFGQLRKLFINNIEQFDHKSNQYKDSCLYAEFGYYNLNSGTGYSTENLIKAWKVTPKSNPALLVYPVAYYKDESGELIYYDNGIRTFK